MTSPEHLNCDTAGHSPCNKDGRITLKFNYGKVPNLRTSFFYAVDLDQWSNMHFILPWCYPARGESVHVVRYRQDRK